MAKLNDVKTLDMAGGEITKIAYNGANYVKTDAPPQVGDLMLETTGRKYSDVTKGAFYEIIRLDSDDDPEFIDDEGDLNAVDLNYEGETKNVYYREQSTNSSLMNRVTALEERLAALEAKSVVDTLKVGDKVRVIGLSVFGMSNIGEVGIVDGIDSDGEYYVVFEDSEEERLYKREHIEFLDRN